MVTKPPAKVAEAEPTKEQIAQKLEPYLRHDRREEGLQVVERIVAKFHQGPLPAPEDLHGYEMASPGSADRIITMAEKGQEHRHALEKEALRRQANIRDRGQYLAITALFLILAVVGFVFWLGHVVPAAILGGGTIVSIVGMFLQHQRQAAPAIPEQPAKRPSKPKTRR